MWIEPSFHWLRLPPPSCKLITSVADDIAGVRYYRNTAYDHASQAAIDGASLSYFWTEIRDALVRLGGSSFQATINNAEHDCINPDIVEDYRAQRKQWKKDDDGIRDKLEEMESRGS